MGDSTAIKTKLISVQSKGQKFEFQPSVENLVRKVCNGNMGLVCLV